MVVEKYGCTLRTYRCIRSALGRKMSLLSLSASLSLPALSKQKTSFIYFFSLEIGAKGAKERLWRPCQNTLGFTSKDAVAGSALKQEKERMKRAKDREKESAAREVGERMRESGERESEGGLGWQGKSGGSSILSPPPSFLPSPLFPKVQSQRSFSDRRAEKLLCDPGKIGT